MSKDNLTHIDVAEHNVENGNEVEDRENDNDYRAGNFPNMSDNLLRYRYGQPSSITQNCVGEK